MLKRLELIGFKSFADKTRFDFPSGITAIVGPNGSGKSNIVDAVRWILGEQSAKSLRGGEMADVIFNGSTSRKSLGLAEVTMTFDNSKKVLNYDGEEVQITRRVYRDGQGEYLINNQITRLKDIKDLFLGSGAGSGAYSIIEQGRVDALLQASTNDRRMIFEEAAGISRFKAKKIETLRKLERVEQNLQRLRDILLEVDKQLRKVRLEASKAQKYQEFTTRLQELRVSLGLDEYHKLSERLQSEEGILELAKSGLAETLTQTETWQRELGELETLLSTTEETLHRHESQLANARQTIATQQATQNSERQRSGELDRDGHEAAKRSLAIGGQIALLIETVAQARHTVESVTGEVSASQESAQTLVEELAATKKQLDDLRRAIEADRAQHMDAVRRESLAKNEVLNLQRRSDEGKQRGERLKRRIDTSRGELDSLDLILADLAQTDANLQDQLRGTRQALADQSHRRLELRQQADALASFLTNLHIEQSSLQSRISVLEELEASQEGLGTGVREVMAELKSSNLGETVLGLVADFLTVPSDVAPLIDLALGEHASQSFLVRDMDLLDAMLAERPASFGSRVTFLPLIDEQETPSPQSEWTTADQLVTCSDKSLAALPARLLGRTIIVEDLVTARALADRLPGYQFITTAGELLHEDGTLTVGEHHAETGLLSRKSELRELRLEASGLDDRIHSMEDDLASLRADGEALELPIQSLEQAIHGLSSQAGDLNTKLALRRKRREDLQVEIEQAQEEYGFLETELSSLDQEVIAARGRSFEAEQAVQVLQSRIDQTERAIRKWDHERAQREQEHTSAQVALAKVRERLTNAQTRFRQVETELLQRREEAVRLEHQVIELRQRRTESDLISLRAGAILSFAFADKETQESAISERGTVRDRLREQRRVISEQLQSARSAHQERLEEAHSREMSVLDLRKNRDVLVDRLRDDYQLELAELYESGRKATVDVSDPVAINEEIADLRKKLSRLGSVNLEALQELAEVEKRATELQTQHDDLTSAQRSLQEIIDKINTDSRKLFAETFATIRENFQELFRKLFGGGMADVILENPDDVLESGIEINARPPGKELRSISLMSGGEKTMTAIALLLAIFRSKPSPFCLLDEVDAALDEANTSRLAAVVREFIETSQFIIITHKKRTMATADVLYGITMQESGISKQIAVRFEDWPEDGEPAKKTG